MELKNMKLLYGNLLLDEAETDREMTVEEALDYLSINMDDFAMEHGWDDWHEEKLRLVYD